MIANAQDPEVRSLSISILPTSKRTGCLQGVPEGARTYLVSPWLKANEHPVECVVFKFTFGVITKAIVSLNHSNVLISLGRDHWRTTGRLL